MFNQTKLLRHLELDLGYKFTDLELTHEEIMDIIELRTLPEFSKYFPHPERIVVNAADLVPGYSNRYYLKTTNDILNINKYITNTTKAGGGMDAFSGLQPHPGSMGGARSGGMLGTMMMDMSGSVNPVTFMFYPPNQVEVAPGLMGGIFEVNTVHDKSLITIPLNMQEYFRQLALADVKVALYQIRNRFSNMQTAFGTLELFIDDLSNGKSERDELIEKFRTSLTRNPRRKKMWVR